MSEDQDDSIEQFTRRIIDFVCANHEQLVDAGRWLSDHYSEKQIQARVKAKALELPDEWYGDMFSHFTCACEDIISKPPDWPDMKSTEKLRTSGRIVLIVWLLIDPDAEDRSFRLTDFQNWPWIRDWNIDGDGSPRKPIPKNKLPAVIRNRHFAHAWLFDPRVQFWMGHATKAMAELEAAAHIDPKAGKDDEENSTIVTGAKTGTDEELCVPREFLDYCRISRDRIRHAIKNGKIHPQGPPRAYQFPYKECKAEWNWLIHPREWMKEEKQREEQRKNQLATAKSTKTSN